MFSSPEAASPDSDSTLIPRKRQKVAGARPAVQQVGTSEKWGNANGAGDSGKRTGRTRPPLSCGECRRLKLKCDRVFPCQSCIKRGCSGICPDGALTSGKGSRYILANTEQLHEKIVKMGDRIRDLETALEALQMRYEGAPHPLLRQDLLQVKSSLELYGDAQVAQPGVENGEKEAGDDISRLDGSSPSGSGVADESSPNSSLLPPRSIAAFSDSFPLPWLAPSMDRVRLRALLKGYLPERDRAEYLVQQTQINTLWAINLDPSGKIAPKLVQDVYGSRIEDLAAHRMALLYMLMSIGCYIDVTKPANPVDGDRYYQLARTALSVPFIIDEPDITSIQTLFWMMWYLITFKDGTKEIRQVWAILGLAVKLAHSIGLHRDPPNSTWSSEQIQERRALYWELLTMDARISVTLGRPPTIFLAYSDCRRPNFIPVGSKSPLVVEDHYHGWKHSFFAECINPAIELIVAAEAPDYTKVLDHDQVIRDYLLPPILIMTDASQIPLSRSLTMQQAMASAMKDILLLQLHRAFFTRLSSEDEEISIRHPYGPSYFASYISACGLVDTLQNLYAQEPELSLRYTHFWCFTMAGTFALYLIVVRSVKAPVAAPALEKLGLATRLFEDAAGKSPKVAQLLPMLRELYERADEVFKGRVDTRCRGIGTCEPPSNDPEEAKINEKSQMYTPPASYTAPHGTKALSSETWKHAHSTLVDAWTETLSHCRCVQRFLEAGASAPWHDVPETPVATANVPSYQAAEYARYTQGVLDAYASGNQGLMIGDLGAWPTQADFGMGMGSNLDYLLGPPTSLELWNHRQDR